MPDTNTRWLIGTTLVVLGFMHVQHAEIRSELRAGLAEVRAESRAEHAEIRAKFRVDLRRLDDRLRAVDVALGKVDQRLAALERLHTPPVGASGG